MLQWFILLRLVLSIFILTVAFSPAVGQLNRIVGFDGDPAPDGNGTIYYFFNHVLNDEGKLGFSALLDNTSGDATWAIFLKEGSTTTRIVRRPELAPDGNGTFSTFDTFALTNSGFVGFDARLDGTSGGSSDNNGIFLSDGAVVHQIARESSPVPGGDGTYRFFSDPQINESGQVTFQSTLQGTSNGSNNDNAIFIGTTSQLSEVAREGDQIPGRAASFQFFGDTFINNAGQIVFSAESTGSFDDGIYFYDGVDMFQIVRELSDLPDGSGRFDFIFEPALNDLGQIIFDARLDQTPGGSTDNEALFLATTTELIEVVRKGQPAPDGKGTYRRFLYTQLTNLGQIFTGAEVDYNGDIEDVLLLGDKDSLAVIARTGDPSPDGNGTFSSFLNPAANDAGQIVFYAVLENTANGFDDNYGIFFWDSETGFHKVIRERDPVLGNTILDFEYRRGNIQNRSGLNELGQIAYRFELANNLHGAAVWTKPLIAETLHVASGSVLSGSIVELHMSDNVDMAIARSLSSTQPVVEFTVQSSVPFVSDSTTDLQFLFEASVFARSPITQTIELFDYDANQFEVVDSRSASRFNDQTTLVTPTGDVSRFIEPSTGVVEARVRLSGQSDRAQFATRIDRIWWNATNW